MSLARRLLVACIILGWIGLLMLAYFPQPYSLSEIKTREGRLRVIKERFSSTWDSYSKNAGGKDEVDPVTGKAKESLWGGTLIDSLDTLWLMGMRKEFSKASQQLSDIDFTLGNGTTFFFEAVIRNLGGLISAYDLSGETEYLDKARSLGDVLLKAFDSPSGYPYKSFDFRSQAPVKSSASTLADVGSCQLEFARLSQLTGDDKYRKTAFKVYHKLDKMKSGRGLYYSKVNVETGNFTSKSLTFATTGDSFFEYLVKLNLLLPKDDPDAKLFLKMFVDSINRMKDRLVRPCNFDQICLGTTDDNGRFLNLTQHTSFHVPGMLLLANQLLPCQAWDMLALTLLHTFSAIPSLSRSGLAPEVASFTKYDQLEVENPYNALRPELMESLFYAYRYTRDEKYCERAWELFMALDSYSRTKYGYAEYNNVNIPTPETEHRGYMPSYFLAETFKYLLLIFDDSLLPLDTWVLNAQAHPFKIPHQP
ncbi:hypothetical protein DSO57_1019219 [Entomophthora muscae]|uniref:Uncharacterized protein n=1 Tax=Entomophthora muscae TaxID=34485 RepID=A0ACC2STR4_9FUNG|nr:hypothetical protein DSO57_1019219 [Entomophthora muscae]